MNENVIEISKKINDGNVSDYIQAVAFANTCLYFDLVLTDNESEIFINIARDTWLKCDAIYSCCDVYDAIGYYVTENEIDDFNKLYDLSNRELREIVEEYSYKY